MQKITPCLWFDNQAEEAAKFYVSIFKNSKIGNITRYGEVGAEVSGRPKGSVMTVTFEIEGQEFVALNGGPHFTFSEAISLMVKCETQKEIDEMWEKLSYGGEEGPYLSILDLVMFNSAATVRDAIGPCRAAPTAQML